jgi:hypothetical protein
MEAWKLQNVVSFDDQVCFVKINVACIVGRTANVTFALTEITSPNIVTADDDIPDSFVRFFCLILLVSI